MDKVFVEKITVYINENGSLEVYDQAGEVDFLAPSEIVAYLTEKGAKEEI